MGGHDPARVYDRLQRWMARRARPAFPAAHPCAASQRRILARYVPDAIAPALLRAPVLESVLKGYLLEAVKRIGTESREPWPTLPSATLLLADLRGAAECNALALAAVLGVLEQGGWLAPTRSFPAVGGRLAALLPPQPRSMVNDAARRCWQVVRHRERLERDLAALATRLTPRPQAPSSPRGLDA